MKFPETTMSHMKVSIIIGALVLMLANTMAAQLTVSDAGNVSVGQSSAPSSFTVYGPINGNGNVSVGQPSTPSNLTVYGVITGNGTVPIGAVIDWWRPSGSSLTVPANFAICDGHVINDPASPFNGIATPNLVGIFIQGVGTYPSIGQTGGSSTSSGTVNVTLPSQTGPIPTGPPLNNADQNPYLIVGGQPTAGYRFGLENQGTGANKPNDGQHVHTLGGTVSGTVTVSTVPPYYGLLKILRIK